MHQIRRFLLWVEGNTLASAVVTPMLMVLPPSLVAAAGSYEGIEAWFDRHPWIELACIMWAVILIPTTVILRQIKGPSAVSVAQLSLFLRILAQIVGRKVARFHSFKLRYLGKKKADAGTIFHAITQPGDQMQEIVQGMWTYFHSTSAERGAEIRVALAKMGGPHIEKFEYFYPANKGPRSPIEQLRNANAGFSKAKAKRKIVVVEDISSEGKKQGERSFVVTRADLNDEAGSMICYPIIEPGGDGDVPFVVSVCASQAKQFKIDEQEAYKIVLEHFAQRILLESLLRDIKTKAR
jgi:hypothetical protein